MRHYAKLVFFHLVGYAGHVVHYGASGPRNIYALFFMLGWAWYGFSKKVCRYTLCRTWVFASGGICGSRSAFRCVQGTKRWNPIFHARVGLIQFPQKASRNMLRRTSVFTSDGIRESRSAFRCIRGVKYRHTIFCARVGPMFFPYKAHWDTLRQTCPFASNVVHSDASGAQNVGALFFMLRWAGMDSTKSTSRHVMPNLCFWIWCDLWVT
jgi:hypothetical protein